MLLFLSLAGPPSEASAQNDQTTPSQSPSSRDANSAAFESNTPPTPALAEVPARVLRDQSFLWLRPFQLRKKDLPWVAAFLAGTATLIAIDRRVGQGLSETPPGSVYAFSRRVGQLSSGFTDVAVAGIFYVAGRWGNREHAQATGVLAFQAGADAWLIVQALKVATQRPRPTTGGGTTLNHNADGKFFTGGNSFPSGHSALSWALATVIADQYADHPWVRPAAYAAASLVAVSRVTQRRHFPSDIFVGSVLGYLVGRHVTHTASPGDASKPSRWSLLPCLPPGGGFGLSLAGRF